MDGLWFSKIIPVLLVVFICFRTCLSDDSQSFELPSKCRTPVNATLWWSPLVLEKDPCQLHQIFKNKKILTTCCTGNDLEAVGKENCGPCTLDMYNLVVACLACADKNLSMSSIIPTMNNDTTFNLVGKGNPIPVPTFSVFNQGTRTLGWFPIPLPPWTNTPLIQDLFNPEGVVQLAASIQQPATSNNSTQPSQPAISINSTNTTPVPTPTETSSRKTASHAAAIAGGIVGGVLALGLIALGAVLFRRRRRMARIPPSARFVAVAGPGFGYTSSRDEEAPPPFAPEDWRMPVSEKVETTADMQRQYDAGMYRSY